MSRSALPLAGFVLAALSGCRSGTHGDVQPGSAYLYGDLGSYGRPITTTSKVAQRYFDQGLVLSYAFNHGEAIRSFEAATRADPDCAMAWWGIALANGPHINNPTVDPEHARAAWAATQKARELAARASPVECALIDALVHRYASDPASARGPLDQGYADAMRAVWRAYPDDADVGALFAEAAMDLKPWKQWTHDGHAQPGTEEILATLESVLSFRPDHPGANHFYVHAIEASPFPAKAAAAADRLRTLVPGAGHLLHMPAHIDIRLGHYAAASEANVRAIAADKKHRELFPRAGFYRLYMAHNQQFLAFVSMLEGRSAVALQAADDMVAGVPLEFIDNMAPAIDGYLPIRLHVMVRFGQWDAILREPEFDAKLLVSNAIRHYARGVALAALSRLDEADRELASLRATSAHVEPERTVGNNPATAVLGIAERMLAAEIAFRRKRPDEAIEDFREAVRAEDALTYDEPPDWMMPVRHALGAALLELHRDGEAEQVFREDLNRFPENGWSLFGMAKALRGRGLAAQALEFEKRFETAWARADVQLKSSCFCQPGT